MSLLKPLPAVTATEMHHVCGPYQSGNNLTLQILTPLEPKLVSRSEPSRQEQAAPNGRAADFKWTVFLEESFQAFIWESSIRPCRWIISLPALEDMPLFTPLAILILRIKLSVVQEIVF
jgi:hypothetical protein